jgi:ribosome recycling factor
MPAFNLADLRRRMDGAIESLRKDFSGLRTGRAASSMLEPVIVDAYGSPTPLAQVANISVPEPRMLTVSVWDRGLAGAVEKAIRDAGLGLNPQGEGTLIRVPVPALNEERRRELTKVAGKYAEAARIAVRNIRRDSLDDLKKDEKDKFIAEDQHKKLSADVQKATDEFIEKIDQMVVHKEKEIMEV